jgi:hypothetical protein
MSSEIYLAVLPEFQPIRAVYLFLFVLENKVQYSQHKSWTNETQ